VNDDTNRFYRRYLPHWRESDAAYFLTWRLAHGQRDLSSRERTIVADALRHFDCLRYDLDAFVIMNDHVHVVMRPQSGHTLESLVQSWKSFTAHTIQRARGAHGAIWQDEYFDRIIRSEQEHSEKLEYIRNNPFKRWPEISTYKWLWPEDE